MLRARGVGIPDDPLSPYVLASWNADARIVAEAVELGLGDRVAWALIVGVDGELGAYRAVYGNRKGRPRRRRR